MSSTDRDMKTIQDNEMRTFELLEYIEIVFLTLPCLCNLTIILDFVLKFCCTSILVYFVSRFIQNDQHLDLVRPS